MSITSACLDRIMALQEERKTLMAEIKVLLDNRPHKLTEEYVSSLESKTHRVDKIDFKLVENKTEILWQHHIKICSIKEENNGKK